MDDRLILNTVAAATKMQARIEDLESNLADAIELLKKLEWMPVTIGVHRRLGCFVCDRWQSDGHAPHCALATYFKKVEGEE